MTNSAFFDGGSSRLLLALILGISSGLLSACGGSSDSNGDSRRGEPPSPPVLVRVMALPLSVLLTRSAKATTAGASVGYLFDPLDPNSMGPTGPEASPTLAAPGNNAMACTHPPLPAATATIRGQRYGCTADDQSEDVCSL